MFGSTFLLQIFSFSTILAALGINGLSFILSLILSYLTEKGLFFWTLNNYSIQLFNFILYYLPCEESIIFS